MNDFPKKKTQVFKAGQIETHEIGLTFEEIECPLCDGSGEINDEDADGIPYTEECSDCDGEGVMYVSIDQTKPRSQMT
ncbi:hypothetical protein CDG79_11405 [Nostoc sp. 'Peltigera membranacea cyanobiont' 232]|nr:hypothetical protein CDG79_11405 [Nostoc sp. 'Peltigera membranacea cyanobiont' 232]